MTAVTDNQFFENNELPELENNSDELVEPNSNEGNEISMLEAKIVDLQQRIDALEADKNTIFNMWLKDKSNEVFAKMIKDETNYSIWFRYLSEMVSRYLVVMVVRDTPGSNMPKNVYKDILDAGFTNFRTDLWNSYIGVFFKGKCWCDERRVNEERCEYYYESMDGKFSILAKSETWKNGDRGEIQINGKQLAKNNRGVNVIVYDVSSNKLIDSVSFDSHEIGKFKFTR